MLSQINSTAILELLRAYGPLSRAEVARRLGLSGSTVTRLTAELVAAGLVAESPEPAVSSGGRPPVLLRFNERAALVVGVDVGGTTTTGALGDLSGAIVERRSIASRPAGRVPIGPDDIVALVRGLVEEAGRLRLPVRGVGIGAPGITRVARGTVVLAPALGWQELPLGERVAEALGLPVFVENDVNLGALGEHRFGAGRGTRDMVALLVGTGVGAGLILNGRLYRGAREAAGEVGYLLVGRESLEQTWPGFGHFESVAGGYGLAERAKAALAGAGITAPPGLPSLEALTAREVFALAGEVPVLGALVAELVDYLAIAVANIACLLNPERVVLGGGVVNGRPELVERVRSRLEGRIPELPDLRLAELGGSAVLVGALALAREGTAGYAFVERPLP